MKKTTSILWGAIVLLLGLLLSTCEALWVGGPGRRDIGVTRPPGQLTDSDFKSKWQILNSDKTLTLPLVKGGVYDFTVDWGDENSDTITAWDEIAEDGSLKREHVYIAAGEYTVTITGKVFEGWSFKSYADAAKLLDISQWGGMVLGAVDSHFKGAVNLVEFSASGTPNLRKTSSLESAFEGAAEFNGDISGWDISTIKNMSYMFKGAEAFNQDISGWDVSKVTSYHGIFMNSGTEATQQPQKFKAFISNWTTSKPGESVSLPLVANGSYDFHVDWGDREENKITEWNDANVTHTYDVASTYIVRITGTFEGWRFVDDSNPSAPNYRDAKKLVGISQWGDITLGNVDSHFRGAVNLDSTASDAPDLSKTTSLKSTFDGASKFNGDIGGWDVSMIEDMSHMFRNAERFNQDISAWNVSAVTDMSNMFNGAKAFNRPINTNGNSWNVSMVTNMSYMFNGAEKFNQDISDWNVSLVTNMSNMFNGAKAFNQPINTNGDSWNVSSLTNMSYMFFDARAFMRDISGWDVRKVASKAHAFTDSGIDGVMNAGKRPTFPKTAP